MLATALSSPNYQKKTLQEKAKEFGFEIFSVSEFKKKLNEITIYERKDNSPADNEEPAHPQETSAQGLRAPFIKVEDQSRKHRPIFKEFDVWPTIDFESPTVWKGGHSRHKKYSGTRRQKERFCECCQCPFTDLNNHLESKEHRSFAENDKKL